MSEHEVINALIERVKEDIVQAEAAVTVARFRIGHAIATHADTKPAAAELEHAERRLDKLRSNVVGLQLWKLRNQHRELLVEISKVESELDMLNIELPKLKSAANDAHTRALGENITGVGLDFGAELRSRQAASHEAFASYEQANLRRIKLEKRLAALVDRNDDLADQFREISSNNLEIDDPRIVK